MYRTNSVSRSLDEFSVVLSSASVSPPQVKKSISMVAIDLLPRYTQLTDDREKRQSRFKAEYAVHFIPIAIILCGLLLWFAGGATEEDFVITRQVAMVVAKNDNLTMVEDLKETKTLTTRNDASSIQFNNSSTAGEDERNSD